jgi:hypothetical protein
MSITTEKARSDGKTSRRLTVEESMQIGKDLLKKRLTENPAFRKHIEDNHPKLLSVLDEED